MADDCSNTTPSMTQRAATRDEFAAAFRRLNLRLLRNMLLGFGLPITAGWLVMMVAGTLAPDGRVPPTAGIAGLGCLIGAVVGVIIPIVRHEAAAKKLAPNCARCGPTSLRHVSFMIATGCCPECGTPLWARESTGPALHTPGDPVMQDSIATVSPMNTIARVESNTTRGARHASHDLLTRAQLETARMEEDRIVKRHMLVWGGVAAVATAATIMAMMQTDIWYEEGLIHPDRNPWHALPMGVAVTVFGVGFISALRRGMTAQVLCPACGERIAGTQAAIRLGCCTHCGKRVVVDPILTIDQLARLDDSHDSDPSPLITREEYLQRRMALMRWKSRWGIAAALAAMLWFLITIVVGRWLTSPALPRQELGFGTLAVATLGAVFPLIVLVRAHTKLSAGLRCPTCRAELTRSYLVLATHSCCSCGRTVIRDDRDVSNRADQE